MEKIEPLNFGDWTWAALNLNKFGLVFQSNFSKLLNPAWLFKKYFIFGHYLGSNSRLNGGPIFNIRPIFDSVFDSIFDSRSSNSTTIHQIYYSASTWPRSRTFSICLDVESWVRTPLCQNLFSINLKWNTGGGGFYFIWHSWVAYQKELRFNTNIFFIATHGRSFHLFISYFITHGYKCSNIPFFSPT